MSILLTIKTEKRNRLYYDRFQYALCFKLDDLYMIRELPGAESLQYWAEKRFERQRAVTGGTYYGALTAAKLHMLHSTQDHLLGLKEPFKFVVSYTQGYVYTSSFKEVQELCDFIDDLGITAQLVNIREAQVVGNPDVVSLNDPKYSVRIFLKDRRVGDDVRERLAAWLENNAQEVAPSQGLNSWLTHASWRSGYLQRYFYIDCKDAAHQTLFAITFPGLFRKALPIVAK